MNDTYKPGREQVQVTASPNLQTERARFDPEGNVNRLVSALGADSTQRELAKQTEQHEQRKLQEQNTKFDWYVEQFRKDYEGGSVSQAQVSARFPETVPIIASRIAEGIGKKQGQQQFAAVMEEIAGNDALRLDTAKRSAFVAEKRQKLLADVGAGNEFFGAGMVAGMDRLLAQHEQTWQSETAAYHQKLQGDQFTGEIVDALTSADPTTTLLGLDAKFGMSSSLNQLERNQLIVNATIDLGFVSDDLEMFRKVPAQFLTVDSKAALEKARTQLLSRRFSDRRMADELRDAQQKETVRVGKLEIIGAVVDGTPIDPGAYRNEPDLYQFAVQMRGVARLDESVSHGRAQGIRNAILTQSTVGPVGSLQEMTDLILHNRELNPKERQALIGELPKLIEGRNLMSDDMVRQPVKDVLGPRLSALESSPLEPVRQMMEGTNARSAVMRGYDMDIRRSFRAEFEETGKWPTGHRKLELIDKAVDRATKQLEQLTKLTGSASGSVTPAKIAGAPTKPQGLPKGVTRLD